MDTKSAVALWIKLAISDLEASRVLYEAKQFRTSYSLFQQAAEKANKAFAMYAGLIQESELSDIRHDQFKLYRRTLVKQEKEFASFIAAIERLPSNVKEHEIFAQTKIHSFHQGQRQLINIIDGLKDQDLIKIPTFELNQLYKQLLSLKNDEIKLSGNIDKELKQTILKIADWAGSFGTPEAIAAKKEFEEIARDEERSKEMYTAMIQVLRVTTDFAFIFYTLWICAVLTIQHSSLTRYPVNGQNPMKVYTAKLPLIKKQPVFMDLLEDVLYRMSKLNK